MFSTPIGAAGASHDRWEAQGIQGLADGAPPGNPLQVIKDVRAFLEVLNLPQGGVAYTAATVVAVLLPEIAILPKRGNR